MHLFLIRHGETVDNVARIIAGVRNSPLTSHGFEQAKRLGSYLYLRGVEPTHVFASPLERARITAEQIVAAQTASGKRSNDQVTFIEVEELQEQDFGIFEGAKYGEMILSSKDQATIESRERMELRARVFIETYLIPLIDAEIKSFSHSVSRSSALVSSASAHSSTVPAVSRIPEPVVAIVSHGNMLHTLWPQILAWLKPVKVICPQQMLVGSGSIDHAMVGQWSNTGFLEATLRPSLASLLPTPRISSSLIASGETHSAATNVFASQIPTKTPENETAKDRYTLEMLGINASPHLVGLHRTRGGVGSSKYDNRQMSIDSFFKRA